jgi:hypothetical protein
VLRTDHTAKDVQFRLRRAVSAFTINAETWMAAAGASMNNLNDQPEGMYSSSHCRGAITIIIGIGVSSTLPSSRLSSYPLVLHHRRHRRGRIRQAIGRELASRR